MGELQAKSGDSSRWKRRKEDRPGEILAAALKTFASKGFTATRLDEVAKEAGISKGTLYLYFESKEALFKAVVTHYIVPQIASAEQQAEYGNQHQDSNSHETLLLGDGPATLRFVVLSFLWRRSPMDGVWYFPINQPGSQTRYKTRGVDAVGADLRFIRE